MLLLVAQAALTGMIRDRIQEQPDNEHIPHWPKYDAAARATIVFDTNTRVENDPRGAIRRYWSRNTGVVTGGD